MSGYPTFCKMGSMGMPMGNSGSTIPPVGGGAGGLADTALCYLDFTTAEYFVTGSVVLLPSVMTDPGPITPGVGMGTQFHNGGITGALLAALQGEQTVIVDAVSAQVDTQHIQWNSVDNDAQLWRYGGQANLYTGDNDLYAGTWTSGVASRIALLIGATECAVACNGSPAEIGVGSTLNFDAVILNSAWTVRRFIAIAPVASGAISALSALT